MTATDLPVITKTISIPSLWIGSSVLVSVLVTITSLCGILFEKTYSRETYAWALEGTGTDCGNLVVVSILLVSTYFVARHSLRAYFVWLGVYIYLLYTFMVYCFALHFQFLFLVYIMILGLSFYTLAGGLMAADLNILYPVLRKNPSKNVAGNLLLIMSILFLMLWLSDIIPNLLAGTVPQKISDMQLLVNPIHVLDLAFLLPAMIITAVLLWKDNVMGYLMAVPLLVFGSTMGVTMIITSILSAMQGLPVSLSSRVIVGIFVVLSTVISYRFLKEV